ncbi:MAG: hypothetical protein E3J35_04515 [Methanomassiliicoccales archaeon]|nr:MAG: hypothetical protein E3J35_04515 [Methanomassiliicoccales archaeon]
MDKTVTALVGRPSRTTDTGLLVALFVTILLVIIGLAWAVMGQEMMFGGMMGHHNGGTGFPFGSILMFVGIGLLILVIVLLVIRRPQETSAAPPPPPWTPPVGAQVEERSQEASKEDMYKLAIRLLTGDERKMFRRIVDAGGEVLQKDLVAEGTFSKAKVTRLLDKLESKRLIVRERYGATNRVRISEDLGL